jgi:hypothetical protein
LYSIEEFLSVGHNNVDIWMFIFNLFHYVVMCLVAAHCCVLLISPL